MSDNGGLDIDNVYVAAAEAVDHIKPPEGLTPEEQVQFWAAAQGYLDLEAMEARKKLAAEADAE